MAGSDGNWAEWDLQGDEEFADNAPADYSERAWVTQSRRQLLGREYDADLLEQMRRFNLALYEAEIAGVDRELGRLFDQLEEHGTLDKTLIAFTSDHGEEFLEHGMRGHSKQLYTESLHVPLWIAGPGVAAGERIVDAVENRHLAPTLLRLSGLQPRDNLFGPNLLLDEDRRALRDRPRVYSTEIGQWYAPAERRLIGETTILAVDRGGDFLMWLPEYADSEHRYRLFDLPADPGMQRDLAAERPEEVLALRSLIEQAVAVDTSDEHGMLDFLRGVGYAGYVTPEGQDDQQDERSAEDGD